MFISNTTLIKFVPHYFNTLPNIILHVKHTLLLLKIFLLLRFWTITTHALHYWSSKFYPLARSTVPSVVVNTCSPPFRNFPDPSFVEFFTLSFKPPQNDTLHLFIWFGLLPLKNFFNKPKRRYSHGGISGLYRRCGTRSYLGLQVYYTEFPVF